MVQQYMRVFGKSRQVYETTESPLLAAKFFIRYVMAKLPIAMNRWRQRRTVAQVRQAVTSEAQSEGAPLCICIMVSGGVGDLIVIARFVRDLQRAAGPFQFDLFFRHAAVANWVFAAVEGYRSCFSDFLFDDLKHEYTAAMRISSFVTIYRDIKGRRLRENANLSTVLNDIDRFRARISTFVDKHPFMDGFLGQHAVYMNRTRADFLHLMARIPFGGSRLELDADQTTVAEAGLAGRPYITVHNGFDPDFIITGRRATKCYPHFNRLIEVLKERLGDVTFVQVGLPSTSEFLPAADVSLLGQTSLKGAAALVGGAMLHIDNEGGLVHVASALGVRSCVIFGPTSADYFGYPGNINVRPAVCGGCWWINDSWMDICPRGFAVPRCMNEQPPEGVADMIVTALGLQASGAEAGS